MRKKYSAVDLTDLAIGIIVLGIAVTIGASVLLNVRDNTLTDLDVVTNVNESGIIINSSLGDTLSEVWGQSITTCLCNATGAGSAAVGACAENFTIPTGNYSYSVSSGGGAITIINATDTTYLDAQCTYTTYNTSRADWDLPNNAAIGLAEYGNWFDIIVIVGVAAVILSLIFMAFGNRGGSDQGVAY